MSDAQGTRVSWLFPTTLSASEAASLLVLAGRCGAVSTPSATYHLQH